MAGNNINKVILVGRLGQDPKLSYLPSGSPVANFSVATSETYKDRDGNRQEKTEWHRVAVFGRSAEFCGNYLTKGRLVYIEGTLRTRKWQDQQGQDRYTTEVVVTAPGHTVQGLDSRGQAADAPGGYQQQGGYQQAPQQQPQQQGGYQQAPQQQPQQQGGYQQAPQQQPQGAPAGPDEDLGPAFPSEASGMDDVPF